MPPGVEWPDLPSHAAQELTYGIPRDSSGAPLPLFDGPPRREQAIQGNLDDCGVIAVAGAIAGHRPDLIGSIIRELPGGLIEVTLHEVVADATGARPTGRTARLVFSPQVPVDRHDPTSPYSALQHEAGASWAALLEKAAAGVDQVWAPLRGPSQPVHFGYSRLDMGSLPEQRAEPLALLTGLPAEVRTFDRTAGHEHLVEAELRSQLAAGKPALVGVPKSDDPLPFELVSGHVYEVVEVENGYVYLRNPWGTRQPDRMTVREFLDAMRENYTTLA